jgi:RNA polymerase sigma-70 factor (ECF subfamily)
MSKERDRAEGLRKEDVVLVKDFQAGNRASFDELVLRHKDRVFNVCYKFLGDYQDANDSAQETFVKVYRSLRRFRFEATFSTWLYRIAVNTCKNKLTSSEHRYRKKMVRLDNPGEAEGTAHVIEIRDENQSPLIELERKERLSLIQKAIESLPIEQKTVVVLSDIEGVSYEDIAHITGERLGTVKSRLARARLELREKLRGVI